MSNIFLRMPEAERLKFRVWVESLSEENQTECKKLMADTILKTARRAKMFAPVKSSYLKNSIRSLISSNGLGGTVYTGRSYAPYKEFGTGNKVVAPADVADYAMTFKGKGKRKVNQRAQPYLFPAVRLSLKEMYQKLEQMGFKEKK